MEQEKRNYQEAKKELEEKLKELSIKDLAHALIKEEDEAVHNLECELFVERLLNDEKIYDFDFLKVSISYLSLEALYRLATQRKQAYLSYLASVEMDKVLEASFEKMDWRKDGEEEDFTPSDVHYQAKVVPIRTFIGRILEDDEKFIPLFHGKITHANLEGTAKMYQIPLETVDSTQKEIQEAYQEHFVLVQDDCKNRKLYFDLSDYIEGYMKEKEDEMIDSYQEDILLPTTFGHPNRTYSKKIRSLYSQRGLYLKGGNKNGKY